MNVSVDGRIDRSDMRYVAPAAERDGLRLAPGDVLFNNTNSPELVGKTALFTGLDAPAYSNHMTRLRVDTERLDASYLALRLHQAWREGWFASHCNNHVSQASIGRDLLRGFEIELPQLGVQRTIAEFATRVDDRRLSCAVHLVSARRATRQLRQAVLSAACSGLLTADWRAASSVASAEPGIEAKRERDRERLGGRYREPRLRDRSELPDIPDEWAWAVLPELGEMGRGKSRHRPRNNPMLYGGDYPFIQTGDVAGSGGRVVAHTQTYNEAGLKQSRLWPDRTVCITIAANIAESALLTYPACFPDSVVGVICDETIVLPEYLELFIQTARRDLAAFAPATAQANINLAILSELAVAAPPVDEQREIVRRVAQLYAVADSVSSSIEAARQRVARTSTAVLAKAFRGDLMLEDAS